MRGQWRRRPTPLARGIFVSVVSVVAICCSVWRARLGLDAIPGRVAVVLLPSSIILFVILDRYAEFNAAQWAAVTSLFVIHMAFSVPSLPSPIYYLGPQLSRPDHVMHVFAAGVTAWLLWRVAHVWLGRVPPWEIATAALVGTLALGFCKELTDYASVRSSASSYDRVDTAFDLASNVLGAVVATALLLRATRNGLAHECSQRRSV
jgi:hypothetical protein